MLATLNGTATNHCVEVVMSPEQDAAASMQRITRLWLEGKADELAPLVHRGIVTAVPGFAGQSRGREEFLTGFRDFCQTARIREYHEDDQVVAVVGTVAVVTFRYTMVYERGGERFRTTGRDLWVFERQDTTWIAVWRTMLDLLEHAA
jgi:hypothetical protein